MVLDLLAKGLRGAKTALQMRTTSDDGLLTLDDLTKTERKHIQFAQQSYEKADKRKKKMHGYVLDEDLSDAENAVYRNPKNGKVYMASRGTANLEDALKSDVDLAKTGVATKRVQKFTDLTQKVLDKYKDAKGKIRAVGHSLGGNIVLNANHELPGAFHSTFAIAPGLSAVSDLDSQKHQKNLVSKDNVTVMGRRNDAVWSSGYDWLKGKDNFRMLRAKDTTLAGAANNHYLSAFTKQKSHAKKLSQLLEEHGYSAAQIKQHTDRLGRMTLDKQKAKYEKIEAKLTGKTRSMGAKLGDAIAKKGEAAGDRIGRMVPPPPPPEALRRAGSMTVVSGFTHYKPEHISSTQQMHSYRAHSRPTLWYGGGGKKKTS